MNDDFRIGVNQRVYLSAFRAGDQPALVEYLNDREIYERTLRIPFPYSAADAEKFLGMSAEVAGRHGHPVHFAIRNESHKAIGGCGFEGLTYGHQAEIGYWLAKPCWGNGIMTEVVGAVSNFACSQWRLVRITAHVFINNEASARVLEKNGFKLEGVLPKYYRKDEQFIDAKLYALVK